MSRVPRGWRLAGRFPLFVLALASLLVCLQSSASAQTPAATPTPTPLVTQLSMSGDENDYIGGPNDYLFKAYNTTFFASAGDGTGDGIVDSINFTIVHANNNVWNVNFSTMGQNKNLVPGYYPDAQRAPFYDPGHPGLEVTGDGRGCNMLTGSFTVHEAQYDYSGPEPRVVHFAASFEQKCDGGPGTLLGTLFYRYTGSKNLYSISGKLTDPQGNPLGNAKVGIKGSKTLQLTTDSEGNYSFGKLLAGGNYKIVPTPTATYTYNPPLRKFLRLSSNAAGNFASVPIYRIAGTVKDERGTPLASTFVTISGGKDETVLTDSLGKYSFTGLRADRNYTVTASRLYLSFNPPSRTFYGLTGNVALNFTGAPRQHSIGGLIRDSNGTPMPGVLVQLGGARTGAVKTDGNGRFQFRSLDAGRNYTITASKTFYSFSPATLFYYQLSGNWGSADFTGIMNAHLLGGLVVDSNANGVSGVTVTLSGSQSATAVTNEFGRYIFNNVPAAGNYTLTPSKDGLHFTPASRSYPALSENNLSINFIAAP